MSTIIRLSHHFFCIHTWHLYNSGVFPSPLNRMLWKRCLLRFSFNVLVWTTGDKGIWKQWLRPMFASWLGFINHFLIPHAPIMWPFFKRKQNKQHQARLPVDNEWAFLSLLSFLAAVVQLNSAFYNVTAADYVHEANYYLSNLQLSSQLSSYLHAHTQCTWTLKC